MVEWVQVGFIYYEKYIIDWIVKKFCLFTKQLYFYTIDCSKFSFAAAAWPQYLNNQAQSEIFAETGLA